MATKKVKVIIEGDSKKVQAALEKTNTALKKTKKEVKKTASITDSLKKNWMAFAGVAGVAIVGIKKAFDFSKQFVDYRQSVDAMSNQFGVNADKVIAKLREVSGETVDNASLVQSANRAMALNVTKDVDKMGKLMEFARLRGRAMGLDTATAFNDLVTGIGRGSPLILDNLGIITKGWDKEAKAAGGAMDAQFVLNKVLSQAGEELKRVGGLTLTAAENNQVMAAALKDTTRVIGGELTRAWQSMIGGASFMTNITDKIENVRKGVLLLTNALRLSFTVGLLPFRLMGATAWIPLLAALDVVKAKFNDFKTRLLATKNVFLALADDSLSFKEKLKLLATEGLDLVKDGFSGAKEAGGDFADNVSERAAELKSKITSSFVDPFATLKAGWNDADQAFMTHTKKLVKTNEAKNKAITKDNDAAIQLQINNMESIAIKNKDIMDVFVGVSKQGYDLNKNLFGQMLGSMATGFAEMLAKQIEMQAVVWGLQALAGDFTKIAPAAGALAGAALIRTIGNSVASFVGAENGADFITTGPQLMMVGEGGKEEHVRVDPAPINNATGDPSMGGGGINIYGDVIIQANDPAEFGDQLFEFAGLTGSRALAR